MILEDERVLRDALVEYLSGKGYCVVVATSSSEQFLQAVYRAPPAVALVDLLLGDAPADPNPTGLKVLEKIRDCAPETKLVVLTGSANPVHFERALASGAAAYLDKKDLPMASLAPTLERIVAGQRIVPIPETLSVRGEERPATLADNLSARERDVLRYIAIGADNLKIAAHLGITERTVRAHVSALYRKLAAENRTELALIGRRLGLFPTAA